MALALILALSPESEGVRVSYDIGRNTLVRWLVGDGDTVTRNGLPSLGDVHERSSILTPLPASARGRGELVVPYGSFDNDHCWLQLLSYRTRDGKGPAISNIVRLPSVSHRRDDENRTNYGTGPEDRHMGNPGRSLIPELAPDLPVPAGMAYRKISMEGFSPSSPHYEKDRIMTRVASAFSQQVDSVSFAVRERPISNALFTGADIVSFLRPLLPMLAPAVSSLVAGVAPAIGQAANQLLTPENIRQIMQLIQVAQAGSVPRVAAAPASVAAGLSMAKRAMAMSSTRRIQYSLAADRYSHAQIAPALLAALPALMPLLQQVLSPQTIQSVVDAPQRMTGQIINGITDFARLGLQADQQLNDHLRQLNPGVDDPALHQLLAGMSMGLAASRNRNYKRVASVHVQLDEVPNQVVVGRTMALYQQGVAWQFPASVETPQSIKNVEVLIQLKQADNLRVVHEDSDTLESIASGPLELIPRIDASVTQKLIANKDYIVVLSLIWRNSKGQLRGTSIQKTVSLMGQYRFDRVEEAGELIPLSDREVFRDYWHQIWTHNFDKDARRIDLQTRYYLTLNPERNRNARVDTDIRREGEGARQTLKLRSGYEYSVYALNHLLSRLAPDQTPLDDTLLAAIASSDFVERFNQAAQHQGQIRGRPSENASLWVFPVMKLQTLLLVKAEQVDENGVIGSLGEEQVVFPMPVMMHFVGVKQT